MFSRKNLAILQLFLLVLTSASMSSFVPLELPVLLSTQCREDELDMSNVIKSVQEMLSNHAPSSYPLSCLEVKEHSPSSPSGYYTLSDGTGATNIVYCSMDELYSCPSLEQILKGIQVSIDQNANAVLSQLESGQEFSNMVNTAINENINNILKSQDVTNAFNMAINDTVNDVLQGQNYTNTLCTDINSTVSSKMNSDNVSNAFYTAINDTVNDVLILTQKLIELHPPASCQQLQLSEPDVTSGIYTLSNGFDFYCHFEDLCNTPGPWIRVAFLNMSDPTQSCSSPFELYESDGIRACGRPHPLSGFTCQSITFPVNPISYSEVCGRVIGYQYYSIDGFEGGTIDDVYVDGVSITHGSPREHIWSFAAKQSITTTNCQCGSPPAFVGSDFFCESGSNGGPVSEILYTSDPLWDGQGCVENEVACCLESDVPWFHKGLEASTSDFIELRICGFEDEDSPLSLYEIYVK